MHHLSFIESRQKLLFNLFIPATFFVFALCFMPIGQVFQFDPSDEGIELIKAVLHSEGFSLYTQIWNDQPPFSTIILSFWLGLFGKSIFAARLLTLSFSTILVWSFCQNLRIYLGNFAAIIGTLLLVISCNFLRLSVSVMIGLPALAFAMLAIYFLTLYKQRGSYFLLVFSGSLLALSLQIKLFTAFIVPLIIFELIKNNLTNYHLQKSKYRLFYEIAVWLGSFLTVFIVVGLLFNSLNYEELLKSHFASKVKTAFNQQNSLGLVWSFFVLDFDYFLLSIVATIKIIKSKQWEQSFPLIWLIVSIMLLFNHRPVWYHHYLLVSIPLTWLATYGVTLSFPFFQKRHWYLNFKQNRFRQLTLSEFAVVFLMISILAIPLKLEITQLENHRLVEKSRENLQLLNVVLEHKKYTHWFFTDCPMYAFYSGLPVPPEIAVLSNIRIESRSITREQILSVMKTYHPEQALLCKSKVIQGYLNSYLSEHYLKTYESHSGTHYLIK
jgi:4-amino-4-deoxy-L-arabinose transferase-like glycosyltransferase